MLVAPVSRMVRARVAQTGHDARAAGGADLGSVFVVVHVADPVQAVFDYPAAPDDGREFGGAGLGSGQRGDRVGGLGGPSVLPGALAAAHDLDGLCGVREGQLLPVGLEGAARAAARAGGGVDPRMTRMT